MDEPSQPPRSQEGDAVLGDVSAESRGSGPPAGRDRRLVFSTILGILWTILPGLAGAFILVYLERIAGILQTDLGLGFWAYVAVFAVSAGLGILPTYSQSFLGGWVFGFAYGLTGALMGFVGGAAIGYIVSRAVSGSSLERVVSRYPRAHVIRCALLGGSTAKTFAMISLIRLPPNSPFALTNFALSTMGAPFLLTIAATAVGMLPRTAIACYLAAAGAATGAANLKDLVKEQGLPVVIGGFVAGIVVIVIIGQVAKRALDTMVSTKQPAGESR
jgi:uncharacterized membrane protein YdjX (TVP38/TMEM64 family)